ncbi:MAG TPA: hypothetical protein VI277_07665 [Candidatus Limnocylindria bacterium]
MGETLAETRVAIEAQRTELDRTAEQLRAALDIRKRFQENPVPFVAVGAAVIFVVVGGPGRVAGMVRRQFFPTDPEKAYDSLPKPMQAWVDHMSGALGPRTADARHALSEELLQWRANPRKHGKVSKKLAQQIAEGPPGPTRAAWKAVEVGASIVVGALTRKAVERFLAGEEPAGLPAGTEAPDAAAPAPAAPAGGTGAVTGKSAPTQPTYSGISARDQG